MKYCEEYAALISAQLDGELTADESARLSAHLAVCPACRAYLADLQAMERAFSSLAEVEVPAGFAEGVMANIRIQKKRKSGSRMKKTLLPLVACLALLVLAGGIGNLGSNAPPPAAAVMDSAAQSEQKPQEFMVGQTDSLPEMAQENPPVETPAQASGNSTGSGEITPRTATPEPQKPVTTASPPPAPPVSSVPPTVPPPATDTLVKGERPPANVALVAAPLPYFAVLTLTQEMTADFLSAYTGVTSVRATEGEIEQIETKYELTAAQFDTLLAQLSPLPEGATLENRDESALLALVLVTGSRPKTN